MLVKKVTKQGFEYEDHIPQPGAIDCFDLAKQLGITPEQAIQKMQEDGWTFDGYDATYNTEMYQPPAQRQASGTQ